MKLSTSIFFSAAIALSVSACGKKSDNNEESIGQNFVRAGDPNTQVTIGDSEHSFTALGQKAVENGLASGTLRAPIGSNAPVNTLSLPLGPSPANPNPNSLSIAIPDYLLNQTLQFGGVITKVSDSQSEDFGMLKLTDLPPFQVQAQLGKDPSGKLGLALMECGADCSSVAATDAPLMVIPVSAVDATKKQLVLDVSAIGKALDVTSAFKNDPVISKLKSRGSKTIAVDYSASTLVFDVSADLVDAKSFANDPNVKVTTIVARWYLKLAPHNPAFVSRSPRTEVGFFTTDRSKKPLITRFDLDSGKNPLMYYIKNVPTEFQPAFSGSLDRWNTTFNQILGRPVFRYEFIDKNDPRADILVPGDARYNIIEWDLDNVAPYGGLGPSIANQYTGESFSANVLVQGPKIIELYDAWFKIAAQANHLIVHGDPAGAQKLIVDFKRDLREQEHKLKARSFSVTLSGHEMSVRSQQQSLEDPLFQREDFDDLPQGYDFQTYMNGYFRDMLEHELGHNLGLRHNFRGNLGAADSLQEGKVSRSIMEYLSRGFRHLDDLGAYDVMAISYGYKGDLPKAKDWYCTDEDQFAINGTGTDPNFPNDGSKSAECSKQDATNDPFSFQMDRLQKSVDLLVGKGLTDAPVWTVDDMSRELVASLNGIGAYALSAQLTGSRWTNFFGKPGRPANASAVPGYVLAQVKSVLCDPSIASDVSALASSGQSVAQKNLADLKAATLKYFKPVFTSAQLACP